jgi:sugar lactone lactonase YvrE
MSDAASHSAGWRPATCYPDPAIRALDPRFEKYWLKLSAVERLTTGLRWAEGPVWFGDGRYLLCSDIPNQRILKWGGGDRRGQHLPQAIEFRQRQHPRPPGPPRHLRTRQPPGHADRI